MLRVGIIDFANTLPLFHALTKNIIPHNCSLTFGKPTDINRALSEGEIDVASISSAHFLEHRLECILLSDLGVGATDEIISIRLFSKKTPAELDKETIFIPPKSASSVKILKTLCKCFWKVNPSFVLYDGAVENLFHQDLPFLMIGDKCLNFFEKHPLYPSIDLASTWNSITKKSFLLAVIATRNDAFFHKPQEVIDFHKCLERSYCWSLNNKREIIAEALKKTGCSSSLLEKYYSVLEYQLTPKHFNGLDYLSTL